MLFRSGNYCLYYGEAFPLISTSQQKWKLASSNAAHIKIGFYKCGLRSFCLDVAEEDIKSAFSVQTRTSYKGFEFTIDNHTEKGYYRLWLDYLDHNAYQEFGFNLRDEYAHLILHEEEINTIWEIREPFLDFPFTVDKKVFIKGNNNS